MLLYNGKDADNTYSAGWAIFAAEAPRRLIQRSRSPFLSPREPYELKGQVSAVVFVQGLTYINGAWHLYYDTADTNIAVARAKMTLRLPRPRSIPPASSWRLPYGAILLLVAAAIACGCVSSPRN